MNVTVTFRNLPSSDTLRDYSEQKAKKFSKYLFEPVDIHIVLKVEKIRQIAEITITSKGFRTHGIEESQDMYTSIDKVQTKVERQLRRHKERVKNHKVDNRSLAAMGSAVPLAE